MRYFKLGTVQNGYGSTIGIILDDDQDRRGVLSLSIDNDNVTFCEECDGYFSRTLRKEEAIQALEEALEWVRSA